jgi:hypothetical protein
LQMFLKNRQGGATVSKSKVYVFPENAPREPVFIHLVEFGVACCRWCGSRRFTPAMMVEKQVRSKYHSWAIWSYWCEKCSRKYIVRTENVKQSENCGITRLVVAKGVQS